MQDILHWIQVHPFLTTLLVVSGIVNTALRLRPASAWVELCQRYPRGAALVRLLQAVGIDPVKAIEAIATLVAAEAMRRAAAAGAPEILTAEGKRDDASNPG